MLEIRRLTEPIDYGYAKFWYDRDNITIYDMSLYNLFDLKKDDMVLDVGANIGAFSLLVYKKVKWIYAIEPVKYRKLAANIKLNNAKNITVINGALGNKHGNRIIKWGAKRAKPTIYTLQEIIDKYGKIDFLKIDCEGCEHFIKSDELRNIRRIEAEVHDHIDKFENMLITAGFDTNIHHRNYIPSPYDLVMLSAWR